MVGQPLEGPSCPRKTGLGVTLPITPPGIAGNKLPLLSSLIPHVPAFAFRNPISFGGMGGLGQGQGSCILSPGPLGHMMRGKLTGMLKP